jgi:hypothetical protein
MVFAAIVGMFFTVGGPGKIVASREDVVAFMVAGKTSNWGSHVKTETDNG